MVKRLDQYMIQDLELFKISEKKQKHKKLKLMKRIC